jgi:hypothetical protein
MSIAEIRIVLEKTLQPISIVEAGSSDCDLFRLIVICT